MFSKKAAGQPPAPRPSGKAAMASPGFSILGADTAITGDVTAETDLHIDGRIEGDVHCATLIQGEGSEIAGAVNAGTARLAGTVRGTITVGELVILKSARIEGDVHYTALTIEPGARVEGRFAARGKAGGEAGEPLLTLASSAS